MPNRYRLHPRTRQSGAASLLVAMILLVAITIITFATARTAVLEQKMATNEVLASQAFQAAEAGLNIAISYARTAGGVDKDTNDVLDTLYLDTNGDGDYDANGVTLQYDSNGDGADDMDLASYTVTMTDLAGDLTRILVTSTGTSADNSATRTVSIELANTPPLPNPPTNPVTTHGAVVINGSGTITNPEGNATIWSGDPTIDFSGMSGKTMIPDPSDPTTTIVSSDANNVGVDVIAGDPALAALSADEFFANFMGLAPDAYHAGMATLEVQGGNFNELWNADPPGVKLATREVIWVDGDAATNGNTTVGCSQTVTGGVTGADDCTDGGAHPEYLKPCVMVIDGNFAGSGTVTVFGVVYIRGDFSGSGNLNVIGAVIVEGDVNGTGSLDVTYDSTVVGNLLLPTGKIAALSGTWRDF